MFSAEAGTHKIETEFPRPKQSARTLFLAWQRIGDLKSEEWGCFVRPKENPWKRQVWFLQIQFRFKFAKKKKNGSELWAPNAHVAQQRHLHLAPNAQADQLIFLAAFTSKIWKANFENWKVLWVSKKIGALKKRKRKHLHKDWKPPTWSPEVVGPKNPPLRCHLIDLLCGVCRDQLQERLSKQELGSCNRPHSCGFQENLYKKKKKKRAKWLWNAKDWLGQGIIFRAIEWLPEVWSASSGYAKRRKTLRPAINLPWQSFARRLARLKHQTSVVHGEKKLCVASFDSVWVMDISTSSYGIVTERLSVSI